MSDFDYTPVQVPDPVSPVSMNELLNSMMDLGDNTEKPPFVGCLYSEPGAGKTTAAMELAQRLIEPGQRIVYVYTAQNWASLQNFPELKRNVKAIQFTKWEQLEAIGDLINDKPLMDKLKIGAVIFDEFNTMVETILDKLTQHRASTFNAGSPQFTKQGVRMFKDPHTPEWPEYGSVKTRIIDIMTSITSAKIHAIFTAHTRLQKKRTRWEPDIYDTGAQAFMRAMHSLYFIEAEEMDSGRIKRTFLLEPSGNRTAKNRIGHMGPTANSVKEIAQAYAEWGDWDDQGMLSDLGELKPAPVVIADETPKEIEQAIVAEDSPAEAEPKANVDLDSLFD